MCLSVCNVFVYSCQVGFSWFQVGFHGFSWFQFGFSWFQVGFHGFSWFKVGFSWFQVGFHGFSWFKVGFSCFQVGFSWFQVSFDGSRSVFMVPGWFFIFHIETILELYSGPTNQSRPCRP